MDARAAGGGDGRAGGVLRDLVAAHTAASGAALYMATGVNQGRNGSLCFWLLESINAISGNLDAIGGTLMGHGLLDMAKEYKDQLGTRVDREDGLPTVSGQQPAGMLADDILAGRVRGLVVEASNPLLACPNPDGRLTEALSKLDLLVSIDLFRNETGNLAHHVLPATTWLERAEIPYALQSFAPMHADALHHLHRCGRRPAPGVRPEWWMYARLADEMGVRLFPRPIDGLVKWNCRGSGIGRVPIGPEVMFDLMLKRGKAPTRRGMRRKHPHGLLLPQHRATTSSGPIGCSRPTAVCNWLRHRSSKPSTPAPRWRTNRNSRRGTRSS